eukprot:scaffold424_cov69-Phaeocystis_antarctica.AAC.8
MHVHEQQPCALAIAHPAVSVHRCTHCTHPVSDLTWQGKGIRTHRLLDQDPPGPKVTWEVGKACDKRGDALRHENHRDREVAQVDKAAAGLHVSVVRKLEIVPVEVHLDDWVDVPVLDHFAQGYRLTTWLDNKPAALHGVGGVREGVEVGLLTAGAVERGVPLTRQRKRDCGYFISLQVPNKVVVDLAFGVEHADHDMPEAAALDRVVDPHLVRQRVSLILPDCALAQ